jgi:class 3 adenylate cyclase
VSKRREPATQVAEEPGTSALVAVDGAAAMALHPEKDGTSAPRRRRAPVARRVLPPPETTVALAREVLEIAPEKAPRKTRAGSEAARARADAPRRRTARAVLYADIRGFTSTLDRLESAPDGAERMTEYLAAWQRFRDALVRDTEFNRFYLANRVGDAFVLLVFERDARRWYAFVREHLSGRFEDFAAAVRALDPSADPHLKVSLYSNADKKVVYYETAVMSDELVGGYSIARRDFLCTAINKCARLDALPEADTSELLCNEGAFAWLSGEGAVEAGRFTDLGERELRGFRERERVYALPRGLIVRAVDGARTVYDPA